jgi:geranylgeranyl diphosphate synthase, type I
MISKNTPQMLKEFLALFVVEKERATLPYLDLVSFQKLFNPYLHTYLETKVSAYAQIVDAPLSIQTVEHAALLIQAGGKRVRPYLAYTAYVLEGGVNQEEVLRLALALELFHFFALVHDDIIDRGTERHGQRTIHTFLEASLVDAERGDRLHISEGLALLAGDLLFSWSFECILQCNNPAVQKIFFTMIQEVVAGQMVDVSLMLTYSATASTIHKKNELKTALYSFVNPMCMGATLAHKEGNHALYRKLGLLLGQAFQIQDDLLDIVGDEHKTGKVAFIDIQDGQHTILTQYVFEHGSAEEREVLLSLFGKTIDEHARNVLSRLFVQAGAIAYAEQEITRLFQEARDCLQASTLPIEQKNVWIDFIRLLDKRSS